MPAASWTDPLRGPAASRRYWTTVNAAEALPGIPTPLNWTWYDEATERAMAQTLIALGAQPRGTGPVPERDERHLGIFFGRCAINVDKFRAMADAIPGTSGAAFERDIMGAARPGKPTRARPDRYPAVALRAPRAMARCRRVLLDEADAQRSWWRAAVSGVDDPRAAFAAAFAEYERVATMHLVTSMAAQGLFDAVLRLCTRVGRPELAGALTSGLGSTEEGDMLASLWRLARDGGEVATFVDRYGYHGPGSAEIANASWRSDPALLDSLLRRYATLGADQAPEAIEHRQRAARLEAERTLLDAVPRAARAPASGLVRLAQAYMPLRETGRAAILRTIDAARASAQILAATTDVWMCTAGEVVAGAVPADDELAFRRSRWEAYHETDLPAAWSGVPEPIPIAAEGGAGPLTLTGIAGADGVVEGPVRVITDPAADEELESGEILVCYTTDPSWASQFLLAAGVVIDIGGVMSHGAIVAREMGIPCVINVRDGTRKLRTGDVVRMDGRAGTVERLSDRADPAA